MSALQRYNEHLETRLSRIEMYEGEKVKLLRQIQFFEDSKERYEILESPNDAKNCQDTIELLNKKLDKVETELEELNSAELASIALQEGYDKRELLIDEMQQQWKKCLEIREQYITELKILGDIKRRSVNLSYEYGGPALNLKQNRIPELSVGSNRFEFDVEVSKFL